MFDIPADIEATAEELVDELHANPDVTFAGILAGATFERRIAGVLAAERTKRDEALDVLRDCTAVLPRYRHAGDTPLHDEEFAALLERIVSVIGEVSE